MGAETFSPCLEDIIIIRNDCDLVCCREHGQHQLVQEWLRGRPDEATQQHTESSTNSIKPFLSFCTLPEVGDGLVLHVQGDMPHCGDVVVEYTPKSNSKFALAALSL